MSEWWLVVSSSAKDPISDIHYRYTRGRCVRWYSTHFPTHLPTNFHLNGTTASEVMTSCRFSRWRAAPIESKIYSGNPVLVLVKVLVYECRNLSAHQISMRYLNIYTANYYYTATPRPTTS